MQSRRTKAIALFLLDEEDKRIIDRHRRTGWVSHTLLRVFQPNGAQTSSTAGRAPVAAICFFMNLSNIAAFGGNESQTLGKEYTTTLFRAICLHLKKKTNKKKTKTGSSVNKSNRDRTSFMPDAHVCFVIPRSHLIKQKASPQPLSVAISMATACAAAIRFFLNAAQDFREGRGEARLRGGRMRKKTQNEHASYFTGRRDELWRSTARWEGREGGFIVVLILGV